MKRWVSTTAATFAAGVLAATIVFLASGLLPSQSMTAAQQKGKEWVEGTQPGTWVVVAGEGRLLRYNVLTGEAHVVRSYLTGKGQYRAPVDDNIFWRARVLKLLREGAFSPEFVEPVDLPQRRYRLEAEGRIQRPWLWVPSR